MFYETFERGNSQNDDLVLRRVNDYLRSTDMAPSNFSGTFMILAEWNGVHSYAMALIICIIFSCIILQAEISSTR